MNATSRNGYGNGDIPAPPSELHARPPTPPPPPPESYAPPPPPDTGAPPPPPDVAVPPPSPVTGSSLILIENASPASSAAEVKKKKTGWASQSKATPLSVEELLRKKREADEAASKVRLITSTP